MIKIFLGFLAAIGAMTLFVSPAFAQAAVDGHVSFAWGDMLAGVIRDSAGPFAIAAVGALIHFLPGGIGTMFRMARIDQLLEKAVAAGINKTAGAVQGKALSADVGNKVIEQALEYAIYHAPALFKKLPIAEWRDKIIARLNLDENVKADAKSMGFIVPAK